MLVVAETIWSFTHFLGDRISETLAKNNSINHYRAIARCPGYNLEEIIANQKIVLHGIEGKTLKYIPKVRHPS